MRLLFSSRYFAVEDFGRASVALTSLRRVPASQSSLWATGVGPSWPWVLWSSLCSVQTVNENNVNVLSDSPYVTISLSLGYIYLLLKVNGDLIFTWIKATWTLVNFKLVWKDWASHAVYSACIEWFLLVAVYIFESHFLSVYWSCDDNDSMGTWKSYVRNFSGW